MHAVQRFVIAGIALTVLAQSFAHASATSTPHPDQHIRIACTKQLIDTRECTEKISEFVHAILSPPRQKSAMIGKVLPITPDAPTTIIVTAALLAVLHCNIQKVCQENYVARHMQSISIPDFVPAETTRAQLVSLTMSFLFWINKAITDTKNSFGLFHSFFVGVRNAKNDARIAPHLARMQKNTTATRTPPKSSRQNSGDNNNPGNGAPFPGKRSDQLKEMCKQLLQNTADIQKLLHAITQTMQDHESDKRLKLDLLTNNNNETLLFYDNFYTQLNHFFDFIKNSPAFIKMLTASAKKSFNQTLKDSLTLSQFFSRSFSRSNTVFEKLPFHDKLSHMRDIVSLFTQYDMSVHVLKNDLAQYNSLLRSLNDFSDQAKYYTDFYKNTDYLKKQTSALEQLNKLIADLKTKKSIVDQVYLDIQDEKCTKSEFMKIVDNVGPLLAMLAKLHLHFPNKKLPLRLEKNLLDLKKILSNVRTWISLLLSQ